jgi:exopolysaccharide biosynthesis WecB/TagA/CpsF family protein
LIHEIDNLDLPAFLDIAANFGSERFGYVVTPNVDHLIRFHDEPAFREHYRTASYVLMDSRFVALLVRLVKGVRLPVCTGSDMTAAVISGLVRANDRIVLIGGTSEQAAWLATKYGLRDLRHHNPPMGFSRDPLALEACLTFVEAASPFRFCFLAVGSPQQELVAHSLRARDHSRGLVLCIGASINFMTGIEKRAPRWMQRLSLEWLYRLLQDPRRLARRYLVRGPRIFTQMRRAQFVLRPSQPDTVTQPGSRAS